MKGISSESSKVSLIAEVTARSMTKMATHDDEEDDVCNVKKHMSRTARLSNDGKPIQRSRTTYKSSQQVGPTGTEQAKSANTKDNQKLRGY